MDGALRQVYHAADRPHDRTDGELLEAFLARRDEAAFAELLHRHGPAVLAVCRRVLGPTADADDAFQAAFLVLVRKAGGLRRGEPLANWLCAVAWRTARKARQRRTLRHQRERQVEALPEPACEPPAPRDWLPLFDDALQRLPARFRAAVVLCELHGHSRTSAAELLGVSKGTLSSRLARGRRLLRQLLGGLGLPVVMGTALASTAVPDDLTAATLRALLVNSPSLVSDSVRQLTEGTTPTMILSRFKYVTGLAVLLALMAGAALRSVRTSAAPPEDHRDRPTATRPADEPAADDRAALQGTWELVAARHDGHDITKDVGPDFRLTFSGGQLETQHSRGALTVVTGYQVSSAADPRRIDFSSSLPGTGPIDVVQSHFVGVYQLFERPNAAPMLQMCFVPKTGIVSRPASFEARAGSGRTMMLFQRAAATPGDRPVVIRPADPEETTVIIQSGQVRLPVQLGPSAASQLRELLLFVSTDGGKSWNLTARSQIESSPFFDFQAPASGVYWFAVVAIDRDGRRVPADPGQTAHLKVRINRIERPTPNDMPVAPTLQLDGRMDHFGPSAPLRDELSDLRNRLEQLEKRLKDKP
jgi:RNA polymerase sigma factor (sigma-70 family)